MAEVKPWPPTRFSAPQNRRSEGRYASLFGRYRDVFRIAWRESMGYCLEAWQESLLEAITELTPLGGLRYRQVLVSLGRQNGKTEIAAALGLLWMLHRARGLVVGIASSAEQARLVYDRTMTVIRRNPSLAERFDRLTDTRGIATKAGGRYEIKAAKSAALQGLPIDLGLVDEVHLLKPALWTDLVNGTGGRPDCLVVGITTAGDDNSELLSHLYNLAETGDGGDSFGFFIWEAPAAEMPEDDETLADYLRAANPAVASGRIDVNVVISDVRAMPADAAVRYRLNRFVAATSAFVPLSAWVAGTSEFEPVREGLVIALDRSPGWEYATATANWRGADGTVFTEVVASVCKPTLEGLVNLCSDLAARYGVRLFVADSFMLRALVLELRRRGLPAEYAAAAEVASASATFYAKVASGKVRHPGDPLLSAQLPRTARKNVGDGFKVSRADSSVEIDAVMATVLGIYYAEVTPELSPQLFV